MMSHWMLNDVGVDWEGLLANLKNRGITRMSWNLDRSAWECLNIPDTWTGVVMSRNLGFANTHRYPRLGLCGLCLGYPWLSGTVHPVQTIVGKTGHDWR